MSYFTHCKPRMAGIFVLAILIIVVKYSKYYNFYVYAFPEDKLFKFVVIIAF